MTDKELADFLARGGQITKLEPLPPKPKKSGRRRARWSKSNALRPGGRYS